MDRNGQTLLGKYLLAHRIGKGGMGEVWEAEHTLTGRRVAVKILGEAHLANAKIVARFGREARAASAVQHPGIVEILDQDVTPAGEPFLVMEYLAGESLGERIKSQGKLSEEAMLRVALPLLSALQVAHAAGVVHRDLKPDNVFLLPVERGTEHVKILDFGISRKADELAHHLTQEGSVLGTPHYMSPEQARGEVDVDGRADVYAMGVLMYECVTGQVPFDAKNYNALLQRILGETPPLPRLRGASISVAVERVIMRAMAKAKAERPSSADALRAELLRARDASPEIEGPRAAPMGTPSAGTRRATPVKPSASHDLLLGDESDLLLAPTPARPALSPGRSLEAFDHALAPTGETIAEGALLLAPSRRPLAATGSRSANPFAASRGDGLSVSNADSAPLAAAEEPLEATVDIEKVHRKHATRGAAVVGGASAVHMARARRTAPTPSEEPDVDEKSGALARGAKSAVGWLMAALAIAALAYTGRLVFSRPDARHPRVDGAHGATPAAPLEATPAAASDTSPR